MLIPKLEWGEADVEVASPLVTFLLPPSEEEIASVPYYFRCFSCLEMKKAKTDYGGSLVQKRICKSCIPYVDEWDIRAFIAFDRKHGFSA